MEHATKAQMKRSVEISQEPIYLGQVWGRPWDMPPLPSHLEIPTYATRVSTTTTPDVCPHC